LAWSWLLLVVVALAVNAKWWLVERRGLETDFLALLPAREGDAVVSHAFEHVTEAAQQNVLVLVGAPEWPVECGRRGGGCSPRMFTRSARRHHRVTRRTCG
jgi:predicted exporter